MRRSLNASSPDSVHTALMSAPLSSSLAMTNSSRFTSSDNVILPAGKKSHADQHIAQGLASQQGAFLDKTPPVHSTAAVDCILLAITSQVSRWPWPPPPCPWANEKTSTVEPQASRSHACCKRVCAKRTCVYAEDAALGLGIWQGELNLPVNAPRPDEGRVQRLNAVGCHDHLRKP